MSAFWWILIIIGVIIFGIILLVVILLIWLASNGNTDKSQPMDNNEREDHNVNVFDHNSVSAKKARVNKIKGAIGYDFGNDYVEIINELRFHPDMPEKVVLEFDEKIFEDLINFVTSPSSDNIWVKGDYGLTLTNPEGDLAKGNYFLEGIDLIFASKQLKYHYAGC